MRHAILGPGGVGGFVGAILAAAGEDVIVLVRPATLTSHPASLSLTSPLGNVNGPCRPSGSLSESVDVLWVTPKATGLESALGLVPDPDLARLVVPLLNGIDHVSRLRRFFAPERVIPATIAAELERPAPGRIVHRTPFARFVFASAGQAGLSTAAEQLTRFGCSVAFEPDERTLLWRKLVMLAPMALNTTAARRAMGELRADPEWNQRFEHAAREACAVAAAEGAQVDTELTLKTLRGFPDSLRSSMQKDVAAGRPPELDAIGGPILRGAQAHGIPVPVTAALVAMIEAAMTRP